MKQNTVSVAAPIIWFDEILKRWFNHPFWKFRLLLLGWSISAVLLLLLNSTFIQHGFRNLYLQMLTPGCCGDFFWDDLIRQGQYPRTPIPALPGTHESNIAFRLTTPLLARVMQLN